MASPHPAEAPVAINPHQNARYTLKLSERITNPSQDQSRFRTVKFNHKPTQAAGNARTTTMKPASSGDDQFTLCIRDKEKDAPANTSTFEYTGQRKELKKTYVLVFDKDTQTATLEPLDETYAFNLKSTPEEKDPAKLAEKYQLVRPRNEKPDRDAAANDDADDLFSDGSATPRSTAESMFGGGSFSEDEEPDESNPFDFRHFLKDAEQSEGFASPYSQSGTPLRTTTNATTTAPARSTPLPLTERPKTKPAPKAAPKQATAKQTAAASSRKRKSPEPEQAAAKPKPSSPVSTKTKQQPMPSIRLDRRASTRPTDSAVAAATDALSASAPGAARSQQSSASSTKSSSRTSREPSADEDDDGDDDDDDQFGGLEIDWGGSGGAAGGKSGSSRHGRQRRSIALAFEQSVTGDGPVSLRSAADSASPNSRLHTPNMRATTAITSKNAPDVIDFGGEGGSGDEEEGEYEDDDAGHRHHHQREEQEEEEEDDDDGYAEDDEDADGDVDPLTLGSPAADTLQQQQSREEEETNDFGDEQQQQQQQHQMVEGDDDDDDGAGDFEDDFEAEMAQALASAAEEGEEDGGRVMHEESEEESEEE
ncbi:hypothetical protein SLS58_000924 [Diplodia intermedia]|uniref:Transcription elongation factor Eaf N-terminal domain-containing protein n=1 Tax=Diplodia intermedia TaxID=856260 RepID=A0ABR3U496_9PEZI